MKFSINKMAKDTIDLTVVSLILQGLGIVLNSLISNRIGTASVGIMTLIFTLFNFIMVLANGNIFISTSRFVAEEIGCGNRNVKKIMRYSVTFSLTLSISFAIISILLSDFISGRLGTAIDLSSTIKIIALSLPLASIGSCIKGYFNAIRKIKIPCLGDCIEFFIKWLFLLFAVMFFCKKNTDIYYFIAVSILMGEAFSCAYYILNYINEYKSFSHYPCGKPNIGNKRKYLKMHLPILMSGYVQMLMSTANDTLVPAALLKYNTSAERALSEYGMFEAMIIPTIFFPSTLLCSLSNVLMPEISRINSSGDHEKLKRIVHKVLCSSFMFAFLVSGIFLMQGKNLGTIICPSDSLVGETLVKISPVIPFIYLEIILECILKGMGKQNFSTINSLCEYTIRILCVIIFVTMYGFVGVLISYYASNIYSNIVRIIVVCKSVKLRFCICDYLLRPLIYSVSSCFAAHLLTSFASPYNELLSSIIFISSACIVFILLYEIGKQISKDTSYSVSIISHVKP